ncbi:hypothetical protein [Streptomyces sp. Caat 7-52]|uniref:hypothetical protein n=1 Tax=Streptomyces sp. Caat 7-52 TaxID=2949637 RepID=UPI002034FCFF|nr:hypothetical protein [Streptomyces sp. Caat 7-52]
MSIRVTAARRRLVAVTVAAGLALGVAGCDGGDGEDGKPDAPASASKSNGSDASPQETRSRTPLAELRGPHGLLLQITSAQRDSGGYVTVNGQFKNDGPESLVIPSALSGDETAVLRHGSSLGGATLVDPQGRKRYYVLRDTDGRPLTTTGITTIEAGETTPVFMQFPAPPTSAGEVTLQLPAFAAGTIKISG